MIGSRLKQNANLHVRIWIVRVILGIVFILSICENVHSCYQRFFTIPKPLDVSFSDSFPLRKASY